MNGYEPEITEEIITNVKFKNKKSTCSLQTKKAGNISHFSAPFIEYLTHLKIFT